MSLKKRIRDEIDSRTGNIKTKDIVDVIIEGGVSDEELREILPDIVKSILKMRQSGQFFSPVVTKFADAGAKGTPELLPKAQPVMSTVYSDKVKGYQASRLDEMYPVGNNEYKRLSKMNREDIRWTIEMLDKKIITLNNRKLGWDKILEKLKSHNVHVVEDLPEEVQAKI
jgi:hypothetical protein